MVLPYTSSIINKFLFVQQIFTQEKILVLRYTKKQIWNTQRSINDIGGQFSRLQ